MARSRIGVVPIVALGLSAACGGSVSQPPNQDQVDAGDAGDLTDAGDAGGCWRVDVDANMACVPGVAAANQSLSIGLGIIAECPRHVDQCTVSIEGQKISLRMAGMDCPPPRSCPPPMGPSTVQCTIPPLAPGTYTVGAVGERARPTFGERQLVVSASGTETACYLSGTAPIPGLDASKYSSSCASDADCVAVRMEKLCYKEPAFGGLLAVEPCVCPERAIASSALEAYEADNRVFVSQCATPSVPVECAPCADVKPTCKIDGGATTGTCSLAQ